MTEPDRQASFSAHSQCTLIQMPHIQCTLDQSILTVPISIALSYGTLTPNLRRFPAEALYYIERAVAFNVTGIHPQ